LGYTLTPKAEQNGAGRHPSLWEFVFEFGVLIFAWGRLTSTFALKISMNPKPTRFVFGFFFATTAVLLANPVTLDPAGQVLSITFAIIAAVCIAIEVSLVRIIGRIFHDHEGDLGMTIGLVVLNVLTWFVLLRPIVNMGQSVLLAEVIVVVAEGIGISRIFALNGLVISMKRAMIYSASTNLVSFLIGLLTQ
jgi:hypothetical protein